MNKLVRTLAVAVALAPAAHAQTVVGLTETDSLFQFQASAPGTITGKVAVTGLTAGQAIAGMDYRPATGQLYALGYNSSTNAAQLYTLNPSTGAAMAVGSGMTLALGTGSIGFDFNPTVDRIRVIGANRSNYRLNPITGGLAATDGNLAYASGDPNVLNLPSAGAVAYTNSYPLLTTTTMYVYDESLNILAQSSNPNAGTLNTVGSSGITVNTSARTTDLEIAFNPSTRQNTAYFVANTSGSTIDILYTINLSTGAATPVGSMGLAVKDMAVQPATLSTPTYTGPLVYALSGTRSLVSFAANSPRQIRSVTTITGVDTAYTIVGMDFRPATGELFALGFTLGSMSMYRLYTINPATGAATALNSGANDTLSLFNTMEVGFDFNPMVDRIRVVSARNGVNYRLNPTNGAIAATDSNLAWTAGDVNANRAVRVSTVAYTNSYPGATTTVLNGLNDSGQVFVTINPPNNGRLNTVASSIFGSNATLFGTTDLDYFYDSTTSTNIGYLAANTGSATQDVLYTITTAGSITAVDTIGYGFPVSDIAVMPQFKNAPVPNSVAGVSTSSLLTVFPNPAGAVLHLTLPAATAQTSWNITDLTGRTLQHGVIAAGTRSADVQLGDLTTGIYLLTVEGHQPLRFSKL